MPSKRKEPFRIAIAGGGIGGLFAALALQHHCVGQDIQIDIYEQTSKYKSIGGGIALGINAARLVHRLGLGDAINEIDGIHQDVWLTFRRYDNGEKIVVMPMNDEGKIRQVSILRSEFLDLLLNTIHQRKAAIVHTNKVCLGAKDNGDSVTLNFKDGTSETADMVIGCDGIHSKLRAQYIADNPRYSGILAFRDLVETKNVKDWPFPTYSAVMWLCKNKHFFAYPVDQNRQFDVIGLIRTPEEELGDLKESWTFLGDRSEMEKAFDDFEPTVRNIIQAMPEKPHKWLLNDRQPLDQWVFADGRIVLLGDAAHAMLPFQGAGAGQSIEDGFVLGKAIADYLDANSPHGESLQKWMYLYQSVRLPRAQRAQAASRNAGETHQMRAGELGQKTFEACVPIIRDNLSQRMKWIWNEDVEVAYENASKELNNPPPSQQLEWSSPR